MTNIDRKQVLRKIIGQDKLRTQEELVTRLSEEGFVVTQATLSRDLKRIGAQKVADERGAYYTLGPAKISQIPDLHIRSIRSSGQLCIIKTAPGFAPAIATFLDHVTIGGIMGTVAGDDAILCALTVESDAAVVEKELKEVFNIE